MTMSILRCFAGVAVACVLIAALPLSGCNASNRIKKANVDEVVEGMFKKQVESILGLPTSIDLKDSVALKKTTYVYRQSDGTVTIVFKDDKVQTKDSTLSQ